MKLKEALVQVTKDRFPLYPVWREKGDDSVLMTPTDEPVVHVGSNTGFDGSRDRNKNNQR